jgi:ATP-binding cassette subfamily C protein/ATP-binding cassette subfamily C protein EexD
MSVSAYSSGLPNFDRAIDKPIMAVLHGCRRQFWVVGGFSAVVNLLQLTTSLYMMQIFDRVLASRSVDTLVYLTLIAFAAILLLAAQEAARNQIMQRTAAWVESRIAPESFVRAIESTLRGRPYNMEALRDLAICRNYLGPPGALSLYDVPWTPIYIAVIFILHPLMGYIALGGALILFGLTITSELSTSSLLKEANTAAVTCQRKADAICRNAEVIDSMGMLSPIMVLWQASGDAMMVPHQRASERATVLVAATKFFRLAVQIGVLGVGAYLVLQQELTSGASIAGSIIMSRALAPVEQIIAGWKQLVQARQSFRRLQAFMAEPRLRPPGRPLPEPAGELSVQHVSFAFPGHSEMTVKEVNFDLTPGESLAVIGPCGAGKSTLIRMLIGTLKPTAGNVRLDGADVYTWMREDFGRHVGYIPQDIELFEGTVFSNIARMGEGRPEQVYEAAQLAGCHEMILRLPKGYETEIGGGGHSLSAGQKQLIGLARAMFGRPKFIVLDEPNSNLDSGGEVALMRALAELKRCRTTVVLISHRPTLVQIVDKVLLLRNGAVDLFGPSSDILSSLLQNAAPPSPSTTTVADAGGPTSSFHQERAVR